MWQRLSISIGRASKWWVALGASLLFLFFTAAVLPQQAEQAETYSQGAGSPDGSFYYSAETLYTMAEAYGEDGRSAYIRARFTFDVVWPLVYTAFLATAISWVFLRAFPPTSRWQLANLVPVIGAIFDFLENTSTSIVMARYPDTIPVIASIATIFTMTKWIFVNGSFVVLLIGIIVATYIKLRR